MKSYEIALSRNIIVDIFNLPEDFEDIVKRCFAEYTEGANEKYRDADRLCFIDVMVSKINRLSDADILVDNLLKSRFDYEWKENGEILKEEDVYCAEFMYDCCNLGMEKARLHTNYGIDDHHIYDEIHKLIAKVIKIISNITEEEIAEILKR